MGCSAYGGETRTETRPLGHAQPFGEFSERGVAISLPEGWFASGFSTTNEPRRLAVASFPVSRRDVEGDCGGIEAVDRLPQRGALVIVVDYGRAERPFSPRPRRVSVAGARAAHYECFGYGHMLRYRIGGRDLQFHVVFGTRAAPATRRAALSVVESLRVLRP